MISEATAATTATGLTILVPLAIRKINEKINQYSAVDAKDLTTLCKHYQKYCNKPDSVSIELDLQNVSINNSKEIESLTQTMNSDTPIYLQYNAEKKFPELYVISDGKFAPCKEASRWISRLPRNLLSDPIEESLSYICEYQRERDQLIFKREFSYDPINLFFEELKVWFLQLSTASLTEKTTILNIQARIKYLEAVEIDPDLFKPQGLAHVSTTDNAKNIRATINDVIEILSKKVTPIVEDAMSRKSAREHFDQLRIDIKSATKSLFKFLYFVLRNNKASPNFLLEEIRYPSFDQFKKNSAFVLDSILSHLARSPMMLEVFPTVTAKVQEEQLITYGDFIDNNGAIYLPILAEPHNELQKHNFWLSKKESKLSTGILPAFRNDENMLSFLKLCGYIQRLCFSYKIADAFFELAGEGGNLLVYRVAAKELQPLLKNLNELFSTITHETKQLWEHAYQHYKRCFATRDQTAKPSEEDKIWSTQFSEAKNAYTDFDQTLTHAGEVLSEMQNKLLQVNSGQYAKEILSKMDYLVKLLRQFRHMQHNSQVQSNKSHSALSSNTNPRLFQNNNNNQVQTITDERDRTIQSLIEAKQFSGANQYYKRFLQADPNNNTLRLQYANFLASLEGLSNKTAALEQTSIILKDDPNNTSALYLAATINKNAGELTSAKKQLQQLISIRPDDEQAVALFNEVNHALAQLTPTNHTKPFHL